MEILREKIQEIEIAQYVPDKSTTKIAVTATTAASNNSKKDESQKEESHGTNWWCFK